MKWNHQSSPRRGSAMAMEGGYDEIGSEIFPREVQYGGNAEL